MHGLVLLSLSLTLSLPQAECPDGGVTGYVLLDGRPAPGAMMRVAQRGITVATHRAGPDGEYEICSLPTGTRLTLTAQSGITRSTEEVSLPGRTTLALDFDLRRTTRAANRGFAVDTDPLWPTALNRSLANEPVYSAPVRQVVDTEVRNRPRTGRITYASRTSAQRAAEIRAAVAADSEPTYRTVSSARPSATYRTITRASDVGPTVTPASAPVRAYQPVTGTVGTRRTRIVDADGLTIYFSNGLPVYLRYQPNSRRGCLLEYDANLARPVSPQGSGAYRMEIPGSGSVLLVEDTLDRYSLDLTNVSTSSCRYPRRLRADRVGQGWRLQAN